MKLLILLLLPALTFAQPRLTNTIIVKNVDLTSVVTSLLDQGYIIDKMDKEFQTVQTDFKKTYNTHMAIFVRIKDSSAIITGKWWSPIFENNKANHDIYPVEMGKLPGKRFLFGELSKFAESLKGESVVYEIRK